MKRYLFSTILGLFLIGLSVFGQSQEQNCRVKIVRLVFDETHTQRTQELTDSLLVLAKTTGSILVHDNEIKSFEVRTDTACCTYAGQMFITSHWFSITKQAASRLSGLDIPLCCGVPVAIVVNSKEVYRAMLWNTGSSFGNKSLTMTLQHDTLAVVSPPPNVPDFRSSILKTKTPLVNCLLNR
jgi:hypothetical protein